MPPRTERKNIPKPPNLRATHDNQENELPNPLETTESPPLNLGPDNVDVDINSADEIEVPDEDRLPVRSALKAGYEEPRDTKDSDKAKSSPPRVDEWQDFFSRVVIRSLTNYYIDLEFRGIDEDLLTDSEIERIKMSPEERDKLAKPFSELANKIKFMRKHGRAIIAGGGISDSVIALALWQHRVARIARKYKTRTVQGSVHVGSRPGQPPQNGYNPNQYQSGQYYSPGG